jgi:hypothetical protein
MSYSLSSAFYTELRPSIRNNDPSFKEWIDTWARVIEAQDVEPFLDIILNNRYVLSKYPGVQFNEDDGAPIRNLAFYKAVNSIKASFGK